MVCENQGVESLSLCRAIAWFSVQRISLFLPQLCQMINKRTKKKNPKQYQFFLPLPLARWRWLLTVIFSCEKISQPFLHPHLRWKNEKARLFTLNRTD